MIIKEFKLRQLVRRALQEALGGGSISGEDAEPDDANQEKDNDTDKPLKIKEKSANEIETENFRFIPVPATGGAAAAKKEADIWQSGKSPDGKRTYKRGYMKETDREALPFLKKYFYSVKPGQYFHQHAKPKKDKQGNQVYDKKGRKVYKDGTHWSAAFVTYCMTQDDGEAKWDKSINHRAPKQKGYLFMTWNRREEVEKNPEKFIGKTMYLAFSGKEILGNDASNRYSNIPPERQIATEKDLIAPGDVVGVRRTDGTIHMDVYVGNGQVVGGNIKTGEGHKQTCGYRPIKGETTDIIKRVKITGLSSNRLRTKAEEESMGSSGSNTEDA